MHIARDWYREVTADVGMHADLVAHWIRTLTLLVTPIAPHFAEHVWATVLREPSSVQHARFPTPAAAPDAALLQAGLYMRGLVKTIRDAELAILKKMAKAKGGQAPYDPKAPRAVRVYVATRFPGWQDACVAAVKEACAGEHDGKVDEAKVRALLAQRGLIKDKRAMPFVQLFKKRLGELGSAAFQRALPFPEEQALREILPYLKRSLGLVDAEVFGVDEALAKDAAAGFNKQIIESSEPAAPAFEFRNV
jgi:leucyl-tRNA synthetase